MALFPYFLQLTKALAAGGSGEAQFLAPPQERYEFNQLRFVSTGTFDITDIKDSAGRHYTNASVSDPLKSSHFQDGDETKIGFQQLSVPLVLEGNLQITITFKDTSAAPNTIIFVLCGSVERG